MQGFAEFFYLPAAARRRLATPADDLHEPAARLNDISSSEGS
jgi:hypothetical protein